MIQMNILTKQKQAHKLQERAYGCPWEGWEEGRVREFGMDMYTVLYLKRITNKHLLQSTGNSAQCYVAAWMGGEFGGEWIRVGMAESLCCSPETITTLLISYTPKQKVLKINLKI